MSSEIQSAEQVLAGIVGSLDARANGLRAAIKEQEVQLRALHESVRLEQIMAEQKIAKIQEANKKEALALSVENESLRVQILSIQQQLKDEGERKQRKLDELTKACYDKAKELETVSTRLRDEEQKLHDVWDSIITLKAKVADL